MYRVMDNVITFLQVRLVKKTGLPKITRNTLQQMSDHLDRGAFKEN